MPSKRISLTLGAPHAPTLADYMADRESFLSAVMGPVGSGKTYGSAQRLLAHAIEQEPDANGIRPTRFGAVRNTYPDLNDTTIPDFRAVWDGLGHFSQGGGSKRPRFLARFKHPDGKTIVECETIFIALDKLQSIKQLRGFQMTGWWFNEMKELPRGIVEFALGRTPRYPERARVRATWAGGIGDYNAPDTDEWCYEAFEEEKPDGWTLYKQPGAVIETKERDERGEPVFELNPNAENLPNLDPDYYRRQLSARTAYKRVNLGNLYGSSGDGKRIHPHYRPWQHDSDAVRYSKDLPIAIGIDFGHTPAAALAQYHKGTGRWVFFDELVTDDSFALLFGQELHRYLSTEYPGADLVGITMTCDPAGDSTDETTGDSAIGILQGLGFPAEPAHTNDFNVRTGALDSLLDAVSPLDGEPRVLFGPKCPKLRKGLADKYCFKRIGVPGQERYRDAPDKSPWSHVCEAAHYLLLGAGEGKKLYKKPQRHSGPRQSTADGQW